MPNVLDLYSGLGGFTSGFGKEFQVDQVDNCSMKGNTGANVNFKMDCNAFLKIHKNKKYDVVLGGPPCTTWACLGMSNISKNLDQAKCLEDIQKTGLRGLRTMLRAVLIYKPKYWVIENVHRSASWFANILGITHKVRSDGTLIPHQSISVHPDKKDKQHVSYKKTQALAKQCFKIYGRPILLHAGAGSGGRYFFGHFPPMEYKNEWIKKKMPNTMKSNGFGKINTLGTPATRSKIDKQISEAFAKAFLRGIAKQHTSSQPCISTFTKRQQRRIRRLTPY